MDYGGSPRAVLSSHLRHTLFNSTGWLQSQEEIMGPRAKDTCVKQVRGKPAAKKKAPRKVSAKKRK